MGSAAVKVSMVPSGESAGTPGFEGSNEKLVVGGGAISALSIRAGLVELPT